MIEQVRLECLRLASGFCPQDAETTLAIAEKFAAFCTAHLLPDAHPIEKMDLKSRAFNGG